jgi:hypothetical protein
MLAQSGDVQPLVYLWWDRGQAQEPAEEPGAAAGADQHGKAGCVAVAHLGQVDDESAGAGAEQAEKLLAQRWGAGDVKVAAQLGDSDATRGRGGKGQAGSGRGGESMMGLLSGCGGTR